MVGRPLLDIRQSVFLTAFFSPCLLFPTLAEYTIYQDWDYSQAEDSSWGRLGERSLTVGEINWAWSQTCVQTLVPSLCALGPVT